MLIQKRLKAVPILHSEVQQDVQKEEEPKKDQMDEGVQKSPRKGTYLRCFPRIRKGKNKKLNVYFKYPFRDAMSQSNTTENLCKILSRRLRKSARSDRSEKHTIFLADWLFRRYALPCLQNLLAIFKGSSKTSRFMGS